MRSKGKAPTFDVSLKSVCDNNFCQFGINFHTKFVIEYNWLVLMLLK